MESIPHDTPHHQQLPRIFPVPAWFVESGALAEISRVYDLKVYLAIAASASRRTFEAWPSLDLIARRAGVKKQHAAAALERLETAGLIARQRSQGGRGRPTTYTLINSTSPGTVPATANSPPRGENGPPGGEKQSPSALKQSPTGDPNIKNNVEHNQHAATAAAGGGGGGEAEPPPAELVEALRNVVDLNAPARVASEAIAAGWDARSAVAVIRKHTGGPGALRQKLRDPDEAERWRRRKPPREPSIAEMQRRAREIASPEATAWGAAG